MKVDESGEYLEEKTIDLQINRIIIVRVEDDYVLARDLVNGRELEISTHYLCEHFLPRELGSNAHEVGHG